jgi:hypothetical protein
VYLLLAGVAVSADLTSAFRRDERAKAARAFIEQVRKSAPPAASRTTT